MAMIFKGRNRVTQPYTYSASAKKGHGGIDIVGDDNKTVHAVASGKVTMISKWDGKTKTGTQSYGNLVVITDGAGRRHYYAHLASISMSKGQTVSVGDVVGIMGNTGNSFGAHTHYEVRTGSTTATRINPAEFCGVQNAKGTYTESVEPEPAPTPTPAPSGRVYAHSLGEHVVFSTCYKSSTAPISEHIDASSMSRNHGVITKIVDAQNPYLLDNGLCWVNDGDIRGPYTGNTVSAPTPKPSAPKHRGTAYVLTCSKLSVRKSATKMSRKVGEYYKGQTFYVIRWQGNWAQLESGNWMCAGKYSRRAG